MSHPQDAGERIPFDILYCSSEDEPFPVTELLRPDDVPGHRGWQTAKNPKYPQSLVLRFPGDVDLRQIQILSHECKIASKVEVRVFSLTENQIDVHHVNAIMPSFRDARFVKLGSVGFNSNEKSKYRSKERKTVHLKSTAYFLKLNFQRCHVNTFNTNNQVGVYSIACFGHLVSEAPYHVDQPMLPSRQQDDHPQPQAPGGGGGLLPAIRQPQHPLAGGAAAPRRIDVDYHYPEDPLAGDGYHTPHPTVEPERHPAQRANSPVSGSGKLPSIYPPDRGGAPQLALYRSPPQKHNTAHPHDVALVPESITSAAGYTYRSQAICDFDIAYTGRTDELVRQKAEAVDREDFDEAKVCKDNLKDLHQAALQIYDLEREKVRCIYDEDFDGAKRIKAEMDSWLRTVYEGIPGGVDRLLQQQQQQQQQQPGVRQTQGAHYAAGGQAGTVPVVAKSRQPRGGSGLPKRGVVDLPPVDKSRYTVPSAKHNFEDEPVRSKYAIAMAQRREEHPSDDEEETDKEGDKADPSTTDAAPHKAGSAASPSPPPGEHDADSDEGEDGDGQHAPQRHHHQHHGGGGAGTSSGGTYEDGGTGAANDSLPAVLDAFDVPSMPKWEQEVYRAVHAEAGTDEPPAVPVQSTAHTEAAECIRVLGNYMTACLLSKRWKLREAAVKALSKGLIALYPHIPPLNCISVVLKFFDIKGCGLQDSIGNVFVACCELTQRFLQGEYEDTLHAALPGALNLLPRFIARAADAAQKTREEASATVMAYAACSEVGPGYVANLIFCDPIDQDKRRIPMSNHKIQLARLSLLQQLVSSFQYTLSPTLFEGAMGKLLIPCLNHNSSEVRDLAVTVWGAVADSSQDLSKYIAQVSNPAIQASLTKMGPGEAGSKNANKGKQRTSSAGKPRNTSAPRKGRKSAEQPPEPTTEDS